MTDKQDYYDLLGVHKHAPEAQIEANYRALASHYHPDRNPGDQAAEETFKDIQRAHNTLGDARKREIYNTFKDDPKIYQLDETLRKSLGDKWGKRVFKWSTKQQTQEAAKQAAEFVHGDPSSLEMVRYYADPALEKAGNGKLLFAGAAAAVAVGAVAYGIHSHRSKETERRELAAQQADAVTRS